MRFRFYVVLSFFILYIAIVPSLPEHAMWPVVWALIAAMLIACGYGEGVVKIIQAYQKKPPRD